MFAEHTQWDEIGFEESLHFKATFPYQLQSLRQNERPIHPEIVSEEDPATLWRTLEEWKLRAQQIVIIAEFS